MQSGQWYMYSAMADVAEEYQDKELMEACVTLWENITQKRMYITGGIGSSGFLERFTTDYDLPNDSNYSETCASIGMALFSLRMANITRDSRYAEVMEQELYNNILAGIAQDGKSFFYVNPAGDKAAPMYAAYIKGTCEGKASEMVWRCPAVLRISQGHWRLLDSTYMELTEPIFIRIYI